MATIATMKTSMPAVAWYILRFTGLIHFEKFWRNESRNKKSNFSNLKYISHTIETICTNGCTMKLRSILKSDRRYKTNIIWWVSQFGLALSVVVLNVFILGLTMSNWYLAILGCNPSNDGCADTAQGNQADCAMPKISLVPVLIFVPKYFSILALALKFCNSNTHISPPNFLSCLPFHWLKFQFTGHCFYHPFNQEWHLATLLCINTFACLQINQYCTGLKCVSYFVTQVKIQLH